MEGFSFSFSWETLPWKMMALLLPFWKAKTKGSCWVGMTLSLYPNVASPFADSLFTWWFPLISGVPSPTSLTPLAPVPLKWQLKSFIFLCYPYPLICSFIGFCLVLVILGDCFHIGDCCGIGNCMKCLVILLFGGSWGSEGSVIVRTQWPLNPVWFQCTGGFSDTRGSISFLHTRNDPRDPPQCIIHNRACLLNSFSFGWKNRFPHSF